MENVGNSREVDFEDRGRDLRKWFRKATSEAGIRGARYEAKKMSRMEAMSF